ncbi:MAG: PKD domain-containing protein [Thermoplasmata archaeon]|nr:MAG: PKD domain-containing protein [Thermoplasmata archaeon]
MAVEEERVPLKKKKVRKRKYREQEEVVIKIGETPKIEEEEKPKEKPVKKRKKIITKKEPERRVVEEEEEVIELEEEPEEVFVEEEVEVIEYEEEPEGEEEEIIELEEEPEEEIELEEEPEEIYEEEVEEEEAGEEVVVISLGEAPEGEEAVEIEIEEEIEIGEEEGEEEPEEAEGEKEEKKPPKKRREISKKKKLVALIIVIIVLISSIGIYIMFFLNKAPEAKLQIYPTTATIGHLIYMDGSNSTDDKEIVEYHWDFDDKTSYKETKDSASDGEFDGRTTHTYTEPGNYTVKLTVKDKEGLSGEAKSEIGITELIVTISPEKIGDSSTYDVNGFIEVKDNQGLGTYKVEGTGSFTVEKIYVHYFGEMISSIENTEDQEDGFKESHKTLKKYNYQDLELEGNVTGDIKTETGLTIPDNTISFKDGYLVVTDNSYMDLNTYKTIYSKTESSLSIPVGTDELSSEDKIRSYSNLREDSADLRVEDLSDDRSFRIDQGDTKVIREIAYTWDVKEATNIKGYPSLKIEIDIDSNTKDRNNIKEFEMALWITHQIPQPIKTYVYTRIDDDGTQITAQYTNEIQAGEFERGTEDIPYGTCPANSPDDHYYYRNPGYEFVKWEPDDDIPGIGGNASSFLYSPQNAITDAEPSGLSTYLASHPNAYVIDGYYNESTGSPLWNLTFGEQGENTAYYVVVETGTVIDEAEISVSEVKGEITDFNPVLSFSACEQVFREDEEIDGAFFDAVKVRFSGGINFGAKAELVYPSISLSVSLSVERAPYGYYLTKEDGSNSAAVDAINGQLVYYWWHDGEDISMLMP